MMQTMNLTKRPKQQPLLVIVEEPVDTNDYTNQRNIYNSSEFIPSSIIPIIMKHHFHSSELILPYTENHGIYKIQG